MRILFMGTPEFAAVCLKSLHDKGENIVGVITQPDKQKGRGMKLIPTPVKEYALSVGLDVYQPTTLKDDEFTGLLTKLDPELIIVAAYGKILPKSVLDFPKYGCINAHGSLLPKYRGAAPIQRAIMNGEKTTGITAMYMEEGLDTGDMLLKKELAIGKNDDFGKIHDELAALAGEAMCEVTDMIRAGSLKPEKQNDSESCYAAKISKEEMKIDFSRSAEEVHNLIRCLSPSPLAYTYTPDGKLLKIIETRTSDKSGTPGTVISTDHGIITVACADGSVDIIKVLPEGKSRMDAAAFINGRKIAVGDTLGKPRD